MADPLRSALFFSEADPVLMDLVEELANRLPLGADAVYQFLHAHPEHAEQLRGFLPTLQAVANLGPAPTTPRILGDFEIVRTIGQGGMGTVYEAVQRSLGRRVALKVLLNQGARPASSLARFAREAQAAAQLHHTNIVPVFGVGEQDGIPFYAMQFIRGQGLDRILTRIRTLCGVPSADPGSATLLIRRREGAPSQQAAITEAPTATADVPGVTIALLHAAAAGDRPGYQRAVAEIGVQVAQGLAHAHSLGILHRDIKPSNLLLDGRGTVWIADFGLATYSDGSNDVTHTGEVVGTLRYLAPERFRGSADARSDIYSLGLTLYELLTFRPAFDESERPRLVEQVLNAEPPRPRRLDPSLSVDLETIVLKAIDRVPAGRYASAGELADDLQRFLQDQPIKARRYSWHEQVWRWCKRRPAWAAAVGAGLAALLTLLVAVVLIVQSRDAEALARQAEHAAAEEVRRKAEENEKLAQERARDNAQLFYDRVALRLTPEEASLGLLNLTECLARATASRVPELEQEIRRQLAAWSRHVPAARHSYSVLPPGRGDNPYAATSRLSRGFVQTPGRLAALCSRDGKVLVTTRRFDGVQRWDLETGKPLGPSLPTPRHVTALSLSPDGQQLFVATKSGLGSLYETASGKHLGSLPPRPTQDIVFCTFSADGQRLLLSDAQQAVELWQLPDFRLVGKTTRLPQRITTLDLLPSGTEAVIGTGGSSTTLGVYDLLRGEQIAAVKLPNDRSGVISASTISPDGKRVLTGFTSASLLLWEADTGKVLLSTPTMPSASVQVVAFSPDGKRAWAGGENGEVRVLELGPPLRGPIRLGRHGGAISALTPSADGTRILTASADHTAQFWDGVNGARLGSPMVMDSALTLATLLPDNRRVVTLSEGHDVRIWELPPEFSQGSLRQQALVDALSYSPDGRWLGVCDRSNKVSLWSLPARELVGTATIPDPFPLSSIVFRPDGKSVAVGGYGDVHILEVPSAKPLSRISFPPQGRRHLSSDARFAVVVPVYRNWLRSQIYSLEQGVAQGVAVGKSFTFSDGFTAAAFSLDGKHLFTAGGDLTVRAWDLASGNPVSPPLEHHMRVSQVMASADNATLLTASGDNVARLWEVRTGHLLHQISVQGMLTAAALSMDGKCVALAGGDRSVIFWDAVTGKRIGPAIFLPAAVNFLSFRPAPQGGASQQVAAGSPRGIYLLEVPQPLTGSSEELSLWSQVLTGTELGRAGELRVLDSAVWQERRQRLEFSR